MKKFAIILSTLLLCCLIFCSCSKSGGAQADFLPLKVGNSWVYEAVAEGAKTPIKMELKVTGTEKIDGQDCFIMETFAGGSKTSIQKEFYLKSPEGYLVVKRSYPQNDVKLSPPELMVKMSLQEGMKWSWKGKVMNIDASFDFNVEKKEMVKIQDKDVESYKVAALGKMGTGEEVKTDRWYAKDLGMVKEESLIKKGKNQLKVTAILKSYEVTK